jgi:putative transposase
VNKVLSGLLRRRTVSDRSQAVPFWRFYYHLIWATKNREPLIAAAEAITIERSFTTLFNDVDVIPHATAVLSDHVHLAVSIPPRHAVSDVIKRLKGASSHAVNEGRGFSGSRFAWQPEYGALTFGDASLDRIVGYIRNQESHHANQTLWPLFEQITDFER